MDFDDNPLGMHDFLGQIDLPVNQLEIGVPVTSWYPLKDDHGPDNAKGATRGELEIRVEWIPIDAYKNAKLHVTVHGAKALDAMDLGGTADPYPVVKHGTQERK